MYFFLLPAAVLFVTSNAYFIPSCCGGVVLSLSFVLCSSLVLTFSLWMGVNPWNLSSPLSVSLVLTNPWRAASFSGLFCLSFSSEILLVALSAFHIPTYVLCSPLSCKCNFPSKTSTSQGFYTKSSFSPEIYQLCKVVLLMHTCLFNLTAATLYDCLMAPSHLDRY